MSPTRAPNTAAASPGTASSMAGQNDPYKFAEVILVNCWLGGDEALRSEDKYFMGLSQKLNEIVEIRVGEIKKL